MRHHVHHPGPYSHSHSHPHSKKALASRREFLWSMIAAGVVTPFALGQEQTRADIAEQFRRISEDYEAKGLAEPFRGITTNGSVLPKLYEIAPTGSRPSRCGTPH